MKSEQDYWGIATVAGAATILIWALMKSMGIIHSPAWVEMIPYFGGGMSILGGAYKLGKIKKGIEESDVKLNKILKLEERFTKVENEHRLCLDGKLNIKH